MGNGAIDYGLPAVTAIADDDAHLVCAAQVDLQAAGQLYDKYYERILRYLFRGTLNRATAEDLAANVFLSAFGNLGRFRWQRIPFGAWLYRIATNELRMYFRRQRRASASRNEVSDAAAAVADAPDQVIMVSETQQQLHRALGLLKPKYRTVIVLRYFADQSIAEIAAVIGKRPGTVKSQLSRGLSQLQGLLLRSGVLPEVTNQP